ncbi:putative nuclease YbcO [Halomonadaceae bacterium LMG 33818]|uniref:nuclease domain-containing protein n=1 Tax=Cernens ardua TaxID=3402176 RepID=UPI003EDC19F2
MKIVSKALRNSARGRNCTLRLPGCNHNPETTVLAHLPTGMGGMGMKSPDMIGVFACSECHDRLDSRVRGAEIDWRDITRALAETQQQWIEEGLMTIKGVA